MFIALRSIDGRDVRKYTELLVQALNIAIKLLSELRVWKLML